MSAHAMPAAALEPSRAQAGFMDADDGTDIEAWLDSDPGLRVALEEIARKEHLLEALQAQAMAHELAREFRQEKAVNGMGSITRMMPAFAFHDIALKQGTYECFQDKSFNRYIDRIAPETKVKSTGTKVQVGYSGSQKAEGGMQKAQPDAPRTALRFTKSYGVIDGRKK
jgi:hypothetical protein